VLLVLVMVLQFAIHLCHYSPFLGLYKFFESLLLFLLKFCVGLHTLFRPCILLQFHSISLELGKFSGLVIEGTRMLHR